MTTGPDARTGWHIWPLWPGVLAAALVLTLTLGTLAAVFWRAQTGAGLQPADWAALRFTILQASLSAVVSVGLAIPVARALSRRRFVGRRLLVALLGAPFVLPVTVAIFGLLAVFGRNGIVSLLLGGVGLPPLSIYGLHGVVLAHVFFNLPLATRFILQGWLAIPAEQFRLAASLNAPLGPLLEWPMLRAVVPGVAAIVFLLCLTSFAVALTLGGGPGATTLELGIYQALRFDFDLGQAATLAAVQFAICAIAAIGAAVLVRRVPMTAGLDRPSHHFTTSPALPDMALLGAVALFLGLPVLMVLLRGLPGLVELSPTVWVAALRSVGVALLSVVLMLGLALGLTLWPGPVAARLWGWVGALPLATSALVMGTGLFLLLRPFVSPGAVVLPLTALVNAAISLPFALRALEPAVAQAETAYGRLASTLGLSGRARLRWVLLPRIRRASGFAAGLTAAISMGDLGVVALFADQRSETLPVVMSRLMGAYRMEEAAAAGLLLLVLALGLFWLFDRGGRMHAET